MNFTMPKQANDEDFSRLWSEADAFIRSIEPEFIILQCGADSMKGDPITDLEYSQRSYQLATESLCRIADEFCDGRMIALGGGGSAGAATCGVGDDWRGAGAAAVALDIRCGIGGQ